MDPLSQVLRGTTIRGGVFCFGRIAAPWCFSGGTPEQCLFHAVVEGEAWLRVADEPPQRLISGDVALLPRGGRHLMGSSPDGPAIPLGEAVERAQHEPFARFISSGDGPQAQLICGSFRVNGMDWHPLLRSLPELLVVNVGVARWLMQTVQALDKYLNSDELGAGLVTSRLSEILLVQALACWVQQQERADGWLRALRDPRVGRALGLVHAEPGGDWSADNLGRAVGMSRSAFFTRFKELVGEPPARYVKAWRMTLAARALVDEDASIQEISERVGYASVPSFSNAFRQQLGVTPGAYRKRQRARLDSG